MKCKWDSKREDDGLCKHKCPKECNGSTCDVVSPIPPKELKTVFVWKSLDSKKGDRLAEVIREALEKHGEVTITIE